MDTIASTDAYKDDDIYVPDTGLVKQLADRVTTEHGKHARLHEVAGMLDEWPETMNLDLGQQETLVEEIVEELAGRDNGRRR